MDIPWGAAPPRLLRRRYSVGCRTLVGLLDAPKREAAEREEEALAVYDPGYPVWPEASDSE